MNSTIWGYCGRKRDYSLMVCGECIYGIFFITGMAVQALDCRRCCSAKILSEEQGGNVSRPLRGLQCLIRQLHTSSQNQTARSGTPHQQRQSQNHLPAHRPPSRRRRNHLPIAARRQHGHRSGSN